MSNLFCISPIFSEGEVSTCWDDGVGNVEEVPVVVGDEPFMMVLIF